MNHALKYAADGFAVFPCRPNGKEPLGTLVPNGCLDATTDAETIKGWWTKCPNANIGLATGLKSGLAVVDLDGQEGIASGNRLGLSSNICALTGNGKQLFYSDTEGTLRNSVKKLAPGIDTRGERRLCRRAAESAPKRKKIHLVKPIIKSGRIITASTNPSTRCNGTCCS